MRRRDHRRAQEGQYVYYHCTNNHGSCDNTYIRDERLRALLGDVIKPIQISPEVAEDIARELRESDTDSERARCQGYDSSVSAA